MKIILLPRFKFNVRQSGVTQSFIIYWAFILKCYIDIDLGSYKSTKGNVLLKIARILKAE
jgi:hypothetical protein